MVISFIRAGVRRSGVGDIKKPRSACAGGVWNPGLIRNPLRRAADHDHHAHDDDRIMLRGAV
ncbi:hypothetical protein Dpoa2040_002577 [Dickeya sp. CFBP 2040]|uniref:Uncharacterized protein n=1 Tax=Dickeya poaceiphila TaxID=568768 RepID=A0A5B8IBG3_9GAMM|nr:hypothetical protein [Dickeya sp. CFBP 2040]QDX31892.1 hypothetical protein Dpoa569_0000597 [Dickeya poaceiphila]